jgi:hypothetical protein
VRRVGGFDGLDDDLCASRRVDAIQVVGAALDADRGALKAWEMTSSTTDFPT